MVMGMIWLLVWLWYRYGMDMVWYSVAMVCYVDGMLMVWLWYGYGMVIV